MDVLPKVKVLNQPIECPWTSSAPLQSSATMKIITSTAAPTTSRPDDTKSISIVDNKIDDSTERKKPEEKKSNASQELINVKHSSSQFFHFLRLMQLFPNVHPATLHTVMTLCKNDFFVAVDKLLYAKKCKELYQNRRHLLHGFPSKTQRCAPYPCNSNYFPNVNCDKPQVIKLDTKRMVSRNRYSKMIVDKQGVGASSCSDLPPVSLQCHVPIRPLSPASPENLSASANTDV